MLIIDYDKILNSDLTIDQYCILQIIAKEHRSFLEKYVTKYGKIDMSVFNILNKKGYLDIIGDNITFNSLKITEKTKVLFDLNTLDHKWFFKELKDAYPKRVKINKRTRSLHQNMEDCEKKYKQIVDSEETHKKILKCVKAYVKELEDSGRLEFIQMLSTWINQKNYQTYIEEIENYEEDLKEDNYNIV